MPILNITQKGLNFVDWTTSDDGRPYPPGVQEWRCTTGRVELRLRLNDKGIYTCQVHIGTRAGGAGHDADPETGINNALDSLTTNTTPKGGPRRWSSSARLSTSHQTDRDP